MADKANTKKADLIVIGAGLAGLAATCFAVGRGLRTIQVGATPGEMGFASGALDLLGIHPVDQKKTWEDPWAGITALINDCPEHPYARLGIEKIRKALKEFLASLKTAGLTYNGWPEHNSIMATCAGTLKTTYRVPQSMWNGVLGLKENRPALIVDFEGMKDFSARQMVEVLGSQWSGLKAERLPFPYSFMGADRYNPLMAEALGSSRVRTELAKAILPILANAELVGIPAILGLRQTEEIVADLERQIGVPVFEIPTLPPSVPGLRLKETMESDLKKKGADLLPLRRVLAISSNEKHCVNVITGNANFQETLEADGFILASGRFIGGGLIAKHNSIIEPLLGLYVHQPKERKYWHREQFFDSQSHPVNKAGLLIDNQFRPLRKNGDLAFENLFVAGSILAHQDWVRMKCGAGLAVATAWGAVDSFIRCCF